MRALRVFTVLAVVVAAGVACKDNVTGIPAGLEVFTATLNGANEAPTQVTTTATGTAIVTVLGNLVSWKVDILTPIDSIILGHIHRRAADSVAGNVRVDFKPDTTGQNFTGTVTVGSQVVDDSILAILRQGRGYVNIHTQLHPGGEIRGTLVKQ
jgi:hypothetical protein